MTPAVLPQLVANDGVRALRAAIADPDRLACEPKVDDGPEPSFWLAVFEIALAIAALVGSLIVARKR